MNSSACGSCRAFSPVPGSSSPGLSFGTCSIGRYAARLFALMMGIHGIMPTIAPAYFRLDYPGIRLAGPVLGRWPVSRCLRSWRSCSACRRPTGTGPPMRCSRRSCSAITGRSCVTVGSGAYATCACFMYGALMAYFAGAPVGLIQYLGLTPFQFGIAMAVPMVFYMVSQIAVARVAHGIGMDLMIRIGVTMASVAGIGMLVFVLSGQHQRLYADGASGSDVDVFRVYHARHDGGGDVALCRDGAVRPRRCSALSSFSRRRRRRLLSVSSMTAHRFQWRATICACTVCSR